MSGIKANGNTVSHSMKGPCHHAHGWEKKWAADDQGIGNPSGKRTHGCEPARTAGKGCWPLGCRQL